VTLLALLTSPIALLALLALLLLALMSLVPPVPLLTLLALLLLPMLTFALTLAAPLRRFTVALIWHDTLLLVSKPCIWIDV
jgi:hypothetical protein